MQSLRPMRSNESPAPTAPRALVPPMGPLELPKDAPPFQPLEPFEPTAPMQPLKHMQTAQSVQQLTYVAMVAIGVLVAAVVSLFILLRATLRSLVRVRTQPEQVGSALPASETPASEPPPAVIAT
jgi:hypothetical protein